MLRSNWIIFLLAAISHQRSILFSKDSYNATALQPTSTPNHSPSKMLEERRQVLQNLVTTAGSAAIGLVGFSPPAKAADESFIDYHVPPFSFELPKSGWKVLVKPNNSKITGPKIFSALDFNTGAVLTVVEEKPCAPAQFAGVTGGAAKQRCDMLLPSVEDKILFSETTLSKDISKLLVRYDDRDNAALQGTTSLDSIEAKNYSKSLDLVATTTIPTGGTYKDTLGLDRPYTILRKVQARVVILNDIVFSLWLSAPMDEWRKPVTGARLLQIWASVETTQNS